MANLTLRQVKGSALTIAEMDGNFEYFTGSYTNTGTITAQGFVGSLTGSVLGNITGTASTASYIAGANVDGTVKSAATASYVVNAFTASYVELAQTASYVAAANVKGVVASAVTASFVSSLLTIAPSNPLPTQVNGAIAFSSSGDFYFGSGSAWNKLTL
jgi:hypothetical protein